MTTNRQLKIDLLKDQNHYARKSQKVLQELTQLDIRASILPADKAIASRSLVKKLWDMLPDEQESFQFEDVAEQTIKGRSYLPSTDLDQPVTMHLGWDIMSFTCSLQAAWETWKLYCDMDTDTFNCCIYPESLDWYMIRAGNNLYPMQYSNEGYFLKGYV